MKVTKEFEQYTDTEVIHEVIQGKIPLYEILIRRYNPYLYKTGRSYGYNHQDTEDLMQEAYVAAYVGLGKFEGRSSFKTWLIRIMLNCCYQKKNKSSYKNEISTQQELNENVTPMYANHNTDTSKNIANHELKVILEDSLQKIPEDYRMVFSLRELSGLNIAETSHLLGITEANVKVRLNRAKGMLRKQIEQFYSADEIFEFNLIYCDKIVENVMNQLRNKAV